MWAVTFGEAAVVPIAGELELVLGSEEAMLSDRGLELGRSGVGVLRHAKDS